MLKLKKTTIIYHGLLYIGQGSFKIGSKEMIHYVKEAKKEALKTVERFTAKEINCLTTTFSSPSNLRRAPSLL
jgi:hypothetical protein